MSVVIPTYRKKELLASTLSAIAAQTYPMDLIEVLVVDDCSRDDTTEFLRGLDTRFALIPLIHEVNKGRAAARNTAIAAAAGDLVIFLDDDMRAEPTLVEEHVRCHEANPGVAVIGNALTAPELGRSNVFRYLDTRGVHKLPPDARVPARYFLTNNSSVPREALLEVGMFDEAFRNYGFEDMEIAFRLEAVAGLGFRYCPTAIAYHIHYHSVEQLLDKRLESARSSLSYLLSKHPARARDLSVDILLPPKPTDDPSVRTRKLFHRALMARPFVAMARRLVRGRALGRLAFPLFDYLIAAAYMRGLAEAKATDAADARRPERD